MATTYAHTCTCTYMIFTQDMYTSFIIHSLFPHVACPPVLPLPSFLSLPPSPSPHQGEGEDRPHTLPRCLLVQREQAALSQQVQHLLPRPLLRDGGGDREDGAAEVGHEGAGLATSLGGQTERRGRSTAGCKTKTLTAAMAAQKERRKKRRNKKETGIFQDTHTYMIVCTRVALESDGCHGDVCGMCMLPYKTLELV